MEFEFLFHQKTRRRGSTIWNGDDFYMKLLGLGSTLSIKLVWSNYENVDQFIEIFWTLKIEVFDIFQLVSSILPFRCNKD